jgi:U32 family peptidase
MNPKSEPSCEILAPAGDRDSLMAALASGAEAVYFGLDEGFNARARASNFRVDGLTELVGLIHRSGARAYLALNTLVFQTELGKVEEILVQVAGSGVDAVIVQDPGLALLAQAVCPELEIHASTQMTISSPEATKFAETLGVTRVVVPRELSVSEIRKFREGTDLELEVFVMGALCVAWSGQCLSSEAWGGRSANRGKCAQACRLPYELMVDGEIQPLGDVQFLLSPKDLAGFRAVKELMEIGVHTLKIEGRQKGPSFVHHAVSSLKNWRDAIRRGEPNLQELALALRDLSLVYSRGFSDGFLAGSDHQSLVEGVTPRHRGLLLGRVARVEGRRVLVEHLAEPPSAALGVVSSPLPAYGGSAEAASGAAIARLQPVKGMGVVFLQGEAQDQEQGGPIFEALEQNGGWWLTFGRPGPDLRKVRPGALVFVTSDPKLAVKKFKEPEGRLPLELFVTGGVDESLRVTARCLGLTAKSESKVPLQPARKTAVDSDALRENLGSLGGTPFRLEAFACEVTDGLFLPFAELREIRRSIVAQLMGALKTEQPRAVRTGPHLPSFLGRQVSRSLGRPYLVALCRTSEQLEAALQAGVQEVELDWMELVGLNSVVERAKESGLKVGLATVRVQKPGEEAYDRRIEKLEPDSVLVRHWGGLMHFLGREDRPRLHGDFSLNVTNSITAHHLLELGLDTVTASHDLDADQLLAMLGAMDPRRLAVTVHHHIPTFHTEHCVYSALLSQGRDFRTCGRPCESHQVSLRDRVNLEHPVIVDVGCRNTVFNAQAQSAAFLIPQLTERGVERLRVEFVRESQAEALLVLQSYQGLLRGELGHAELVDRVGVHEQFGVTKGTMQLLV